MAQVGRISGPLLQENLIRNGIDLAFETDLIYLDVNSGRVGVRTNSPSNELQNSLTTRTTNLIVDTEANVNGIINIQNSTIQPFPGSLFLDSENVITANRVKTDNILIDDDRISTYTANTNLELRPNGTGRTEFKNLWVENNLNVTGDVRLDGNITFGNSDTDSVAFDADVTSNIIPDATDTYNLGNPNKRWQTIYSRLLNGQDINAQVAIIGGVDIGTRQGNLWYVATNGDNSNVGDHQQGPFRTIDYAVTQASAGDTIYVFPGEYEETCPIEVPAGVTIIGENIRNTIVKPPASDNYVDVFLLNGESTVANLTVKDFYYDSLNDVGYAFRFANGATITSRSPYIQNVTVVTQGSVTSPSDPRGFSQGDAGKGALVDGADVLGSSEEASMLFHAATFITPGVDAITMTNGVRVEWLNSFTYFANRGLYAVDGATGHLSTDGSTIKYGAELRAIGSANVYGNYGAVADGTDTLMYLIQHNMAYIGVGKYVDNDPSRVIQSNEIVKLNSGKIYYQTVNHFGDFRIGDNFFINQETGESSIVITSGEVQGFGRLRITSTDTGNVTLIDGEQISTGNFTFTGNSAFTFAGDYNIDAATGTTNLNSNVDISKNLDITGDLSFDGSLNLLGNESTDTLKFNVDIDQNFNPNTDSSFDLGSVTKEWTNVWLSSSNIGDTFIQDNYITSDISNANLEIRANGSGDIFVPSNNVIIDNNLTVDGLTTLIDYNIVGDLDLTGNSTADSNASISNDFIITQNLNVGSDVQLEEVNIAGNVITTTTSNADLELRANGTGIVLIPSADVNIVNNLSVDDIFNNTNVNVTLQTEFGLADVSDIDISGNYVKTNNGNLDLTLSATGNVVVPANNVTFSQNLTVGTLTDLQGTTITGQLDHTGAYNQTGNYTIGGELTVDSLYFEDNFITTNTSNADLELRTSGPVVLTISLSVAGGNGGISPAYSTTTSSSAGGGAGGYSGNGGNGGTPGSNIGTAGTGGGGGGGYSNNGGGAGGGVGLLGEGASGARGGFSSPGGKGGSGGTDGGSYGGPGGLFGGGGGTTNTSASQSSGGGGGLRYVNDIPVSPGQTYTLTIGSGGTAAGASGAGGNGGMRIIWGEGRAYPSTNTADVGDQQVVYDTPGIYEWTVPEGVTSICVVCVGGGASGWGGTDGGNTSFGTLFFAEGGKTPLTQKGTGAGGGGSTEAIVPVGDGGESKVSIPNNNVQIDNNLTVNSNTSLQGTTVTGLLTQTGNKTQVGNYTQTGDLVVDGKFTSDRYVQFTDVNINDNVITTTIGNNDLDLRAAGTGQVIVPNNNVIVSNNLFASSITVGDINIANDLVLDDIVVRDSNIQINDNYITTNVSNSDLELRATGDVVVRSNNVILDQNLTVNGSTDIDGLTVNGNITHVGNNTQTGDLGITGDITISGEFTIADQPFQFEDISIDGNVVTTTLSNSNLDLRANGTGILLIPNNNVNIVSNLTVNDVTVNDIVINNSFALENMVSSTDIDIFDNVITTTNSNSNLELRANGSGAVRLQDIAIENSVMFTDETAITFTNSNTVINANGSLQIPIGSSLQRVESIPEQIVEGGDAGSLLLTVYDGGDAGTTFGPGDLILDAGVALTPEGNAGDIRFNSDYNLFEGFSSTDQFFGGVFSQNSLTNIQSLNDNLDFKVNNSLVGRINTSVGFFVTGLDVDNIQIRNNLVSSVNNQDLLLTPNGTGSIVVSDLTVDDNKFINASATGLHIATTGNSYVKIVGSNGYVTPVGDESNKGSTPQLGEIRWNTELEIEEVYNGTVWIPARGIVDNVTLSQMGELIDEWSLILG